MTAKNPATALQITSFFHHAMGGTLAMGFSTNGAVSATDSTANGTTRKTCNRCSRKQIATAQTVARQEARMAGAMMPVG